MKHIQLLVVSMLGGVLLAAAGQNPQWWTNRGVLNATASSADHEPANVGQLKHVAEKGMIELEHALNDKGGAGLDVEDCIDAFSVSSTDANFLKLGQLKYVSSLFYDRFEEVAVDLPFLHASLPVQEGQRYPWTDILSDDEDDAIANIGQLKYVFSFDFDKNGDETIDWLEGDTDGDGLSYAEEVALSTNPWSRDTDGDGVTDREERDRGLNPISMDSDGDGVVDDGQAYAEAIAAVVSTTLTGGMKHWDLATAGAQQYYAVAGMENLDAAVSVESLDADPGTERNGSEDSIESCVYSWGAQYYKPTYWAGFVDKEPHRYYTGITVNYDIKGKRPPSPLSPNPSAPFEEWPVVYDCSTTNAIFSMHSRKLNGSGSGAHKCLGAGYLTSYSIASTWLSVDNVSTVNDAYTFCGFSPSIYDDHLSLNLQDEYDRFLFSNKYRHFNLDYPDLYYVGKTMRLAGVSPESDSSCALNSYRWDAVKKSPGDDNYDDWQDDNRLFYNDHCEEYIATLSCQLHDEYT